jgi:Sec7-like guanine-nucleotide exchange factor
MAGYQTLKKVLSVKSHYKPIEQVRAWSYQQKSSNLNNFQKISENNIPTILVRKVRKII